MNQKSPHKFFLIVLFFSVGLFSCNANREEYVITIANNSELSRTSETVELELSDLPDFSSDNYGKICVNDNSGKKILSQLIDVDSNSIADYLIFQSDFDARESKQFTIVSSDCEEALLESTAKTFCRFAPERIDDFAWENDEVAFRVYGPKCQQMFEEGTPGGLISSGIDCWLKRVNYPIIDKWYKKNEQGGSYHVDDGEGLDNYHVGTSRGCGGTAIYNDGNYVLSENYTKWKIIANGPIRSVFELEYPSYVSGGLSVSERKTFTIDLGTNFYLCDVKYDCIELVERAAIGITHHDKEGEITFNEEKGWLTFWEPLDDSFLGTAIIIESGALSSSEISSNKDSDNNWVNLKTNNSSFSYWAGFGWKKAGQFSSSAEWNDFVSKISQIKNNPLSIKIEKYLQ